MPTGRLSIEEKIEAVDSLSIMIENEGSIVAQINVGKDENGETSVFMMNVNVPWDRPINGVHLTYNRAFEDKINPVEPNISEPALADSFTNALTKYDEEMSLKAQESLERRSTNGVTFEAALKALPQIKTPPQHSDAETESSYSQDELGDLSKFLKICSAGKKYSLRVKADGGILSELKDVSHASKSTKRNVYVVSKPERGSDDPPFTMVLSKTRPKHCVNVRSLPIGVDIWLTKHIPNHKQQSITIIEYTMLQQIREALVSFFSF